MDGEEVVDRSDKSPLRKVILEPNAFPLNHVWSKGPACFSDVKFPSLDGKVAYEDGQHLTVPAKKA